MFTAGRKVLIISCEDAPRAAGRTGRIVDEVPPGPLTKGRWTVARVGLLVGPVLCRTGELQRVG
ncbi:hypothetical protein [Streptomyces sp. NPDC048172]|uniref:hypothetical protein n=1 Tax=Streptomyces sp. NPDC048172 TaxID=3365505 RepID=UPI00371B893A